MKLVRHLITDFISVQNHNNTNWSYCVVKTQFIEYYFLHFMKLLSQSWTFWIETYDFLHGSWLGICPICARWNFHHNIKRSWREAISKHCDITKGWPVWDFVLIVLFSFFGIYQPFLAFFFLQYFSCPIKMMILTLDTNKIPFFMVWELDICPHGK